MVGILLRILLTLQLKFLYMESVASFLASEHPTAFSFEILPPLRGKSINGTYADIAKLMEFGPAYINITTHRNEVSYRDMGGGMFREVTSQRRPGTVAIAAAIRERFGVRPVPHLICGEYTRREIEDQLIDLSYLGITDILVLRGDRGGNAPTFCAVPDGHGHADSLVSQVVDFNQGIMADGSKTAPEEVPITFGVAGYPEKHEEAMNADIDMANLKAKVDKGASYIVTQMFFDNERYFDFVRRARQAGITVPIVPGIKPLTSLRQMMMLPRIFHIDLPQELASRLLECKSDDDVRETGVEWGIRQARELKDACVPSIHFYSMHATNSVARIAREVY